jgi:polyhydroxybutyrate depolymerase
LAGRSVIGILGEPVRKVGVVVAAGLVVLAASCSSSSGSKAASGGKSTSRVTAAIPASAVPAAPSVGCTLQNPAPAAGSTKQTITSGGASRWYWLDLPPAVSTGKPLPLVLDLHGYSEGADVHVAMSGLGKFGESQGFVTVTPQGSGKVPRWNTGLHSADMNFLGHLLDVVERKECIDTNRVYSTGLSNGAFMTSAVACRYSDRIAAVAPVAGARVITGCKLTRPVPIVAFHGTADGYVSFNGGLGQKGLDLPAPDGSGRKLRDIATPSQLAAGGKDSIPKIMEAWAKRNGCAPGTKEQKVAVDVFEVTSNCPPGAEAVLYRVEGAGHTWPGSPFSQSIVSIVGPTTMNINANEIMWDFFMKHPLGAASGNAGS